MACEVIMTAGYEGKTLDGFLCLLKENAVEQLLDVRYNPISRKPGFSKKKLAASLERVGIKYIHIRELGIPSDARRNLKTRRDYQKLLRKYRASIMPEADVFVRQAAAFASERLSVIMCFEKDVSCCHRSPLADQVAVYADSKVKHI